MANIFTICLGIVKSSEISVKSEQNNNSDFTMYNITIDDYNNLSQSPLIKTKDYSYSIGNVLDNKSNEYDINLFYCNKEYFKTNNINYITGNYPVNYNEILIGRNVLKKISSQASIGSSITLSINSEGEINNDNFIIAGCFDDTDYKEKPDIYVSEEYYNSKGFNNSRTNRITSDISLRYKFQIDKTANYLINKYNIRTPGYYKINWSLNYIRDNQLLAILVLVIILAIAGSVLIISNILRIFYDDEKTVFYMMRVMGMTIRQERRIVLYIMMFSTSISIIIGTVTGYTAGLYIFPSLNRIIFSNILNSYINAAPNILTIFFITALTTYITVITAYKKMYLRKSISLHKEKGIAISPLLRNFSIKGKMYRLAFLNIIKDKKKFCTLVFPLVFSLLVFNMAASSINSFSMSKLKNDPNTGDYQIYNKKFFSYLTNSYNPYINTNIIDSLRSYGFIENEGSAYFSNSAEIKCNGLIFKDVYVYTYDNYIYDDFSIKEFPHGIYLSTSFLNSDYNLNGPVEIITSDKCYSFDKIDYLDIPEELCTSSSVFAENNDPKGILQCVIPSSVFNDLPGKGKTTGYYFNVKDSSTENVEKVLHSICDNNNTISFRSASTIRNEMRKFKISYVLISFLLTSVILVITVLNLLYSYVSGYNRYNKELSLLSSIGVTKTELKKCIFFEGIYYSAAIVIFELTAVALCNILLTKTSLISTIRLTLLPVVLTWPPILYISICVPLKLSNKKRYQIN